jgi:hypothetical protein
MVHKHLLSIAKEPLPTEAIIKRIGLFSTVTDWLVALLDLIFGFLESSPVYSFEMLLRGQGRDRLVFNLLGL